MVSANDTTPEVRQTENAALATLAKDGDQSAVDRLWELNRGLISVCCRRWLRKNPTIASSAGLELDDLLQEGYFAVTKAVQHFDKSRGNFSSCLAVEVQRQIIRMVNGEHLHTVTDLDGKQRRVSGNPLNSCGSLDAPMTAGDGEPGDITLLDPQADESATDALLDVEQRLYNEQAREVLSAAVGALAPREADCVRRHYFDGETLERVGKSYGVSREAVRQTEQTALKKLRRNKRVAGLTRLTGLQRHRVAVLERVPSQRTGSIRRAAGAAWPSVCGCGIYRGWGDGMA